MKKLRMGKEDYPEVQVRLIETAAISMPRWADNYSWELLEEVYEYFPSAIAACIRASMNKRKVSEQELQGVTIHSFSSGLFANGIHKL